jgi:hypothetical protein
MKPQEKIIETYITNSSLPLVLTSNDPFLSITDWLTENKEYFESQLCKYGAILFRGFGVDTLEKFQNFMNCFENKPLPYMFRSSPRKEIENNVKNIYHSTIYPKHQSIIQHNESSYSRVWGMKIVFCCMRKADSGGETPLCDSRKILNDIPFELKMKFKSKGVKYLRNLFPQLGLSWQEVFQTKIKKEMIEICNKNKIHYEFISEEMVSISWIKPAIYQHPYTKEEIWFNHALLFNKFSLYEIAGLSENDQMPDDLITQDTFYGDGTKISYQEYQTVKNAFKKNTVAFPYENGDVLVLDNMLTSHGRNPFKGERLIATSIIEPNQDEGFHF